MPDFAFSKGVFTFVVGAIGSTEIGVADDEAFPLAVDVDEPAGDVVSEVRTNLDGAGIVNIETVQVDDKLDIFLFNFTSGSPKTIKRLPAPVFLSRSPLMARSGFIQGDRTVSVT